MPGDELDQLIAPFSLKGVVVGQRVPKGTRVNDLGQTENIYEVVGDPEWGVQQSEMTSYQIEYLTWHQTYHKGVRDPRCTICTAEAKFQQEQEPHLKNHRATRQYDPSCRFCQDDRFFGRM